MAISMCLALNMFLRHRKSVVETGQMSSVATGHMSCLATRQMSSVGTGQISAVETGQMSPAAARCYWLPLAILS